MTDEKKIQVELVDADSWAHVTVSIPSDTHLCYPILYDDNYYRYSCTENGEGNPIFWKTRITEVK